jgi:hypothetical protein
MKSMLVGGWTGSPRAEMYEAMPCLLVYGR